MLGEHGVCDAAAYCVQRLSRRELAELDLERKYSKEDTVEAAICNGRRRDGTIRRQPWCMYVAESDGQGRQAMKRFGREELSKVVGCLLFSLELVEDGVVIAWQDSF